MAVNSRKMKTFTSLASLAVLVAQATAHCKSLILAVVSSH